MSGMEIQPRENSSLLAAGQQYQAHSSREWTAEEALEKAFADLSEFEKSSAWTGAGNNANFAKHNALRNAVEIAKANVAKVGIELQASGNKFKQLQGQNPDLGQNLHLIG